MVSRVVGFMSIMDSSGDTLPKTNIAPEKMKFQKVSCIPTINFQVLCHVGFPECICFDPQK